MHNVPVSLRMSAALWSAAGALAWTVALWMRACGVDVGVLAATPSRRAGHSSTVRRSVLHWWLPGWLTQKSFGCAAASAVLLPYVGCQVALVFMLARVTFKVLSCEPWLQDLISLHCTEGLLFSVTAVQVMGLQT